MSSNRHLGRVLVTGAGGFVGRRLLLHLKALGAEVRGLTRLDADLDDPLATGRVIAAYRPDTVFHLAARLPNQMDESYRSVAAEHAMTVNVIAAMERDSRLIVAGSVAEIGFAGTHDEYVLCRPNNVYGMAKHACVGEALSRRGLGWGNVCVARLFGVYGPGEHSRRLIPAILWAGAAREQIALSDGAQIRDFIHIDDLCEGLLRLSRLAEVPPLLNMGTGVGLSVRTVCERVGKWARLEHDQLRFGEIERRGVDEEVLIADTKLTQDVLGWVPPQRLDGPFDFLEEIRRAALSIVARSDGGNRTS